VSIRWIAGAEIVIGETVFDEGVNTSTIKAAVERCHLVRFMSRGRRPSALDAGASPGG